jgi:hypothetical protein
MAIAKFPGLGKVLWFAMDGVQDPEKWLADMAPGSKDLQVRYQRRVELKEALRHKVPSNPTPFEGRFSPMVENGYDEFTPFVVARINEDGSMGWILPIGTDSTEPNKTLTFLNGQVIEVKKDGEMHEVYPATKSWADVAAEIKAVRDEQKQKALQARQKLLMSLETTENVEA